MTIDEAVYWLRKFVIWSLRNDAVAKAGFQILNEHLDDGGEEFFNAAKQYRVSEINKEITELEAERAELQS